MGSSFDSAPWFQAIEALFRADEAACLQKLIPDVSLDSVARARVEGRALRWAGEIRRLHKPLAGATDMLARYGLSSQEGTALMCLAEALLRIPDPGTADALIRDKLAGARWDETLGDAAPFAATAAGWALALTGKIAGLEDAKSPTPGAFLGRIVARLGQPVAREALRAAMRWMADQFVMAETIGAALDRARPEAEDGVRFSFDMLGEGARTAADAERYFDAYARALDAVGAHQAGAGHLRAPGVSVKLSALHPRYEFAQRETVLAELAPRLAQLCEKAARFNIPLTVDAEESDRLFLALEVFAATLGAARLEGWEGLGFAVQAYEKRAPAVIDWFAALAQAHGRRLGLRLVKGAYWDTEIKRAQERGWSDFPTFTRKAATDVSYLACARRLLASDWIKPVFGTHNALTAAHILEIARDPARLEFQRLHGMGEELHTLMRAEGIACCVYAPVGNHDVLLGYLVRRLLENGANSSFVHRLYNASVPVGQLVTDPVDALRAAPLSLPATLKRPPDLYAPERRAAAGLDLTDPFVTEPLLATMSETLGAAHDAAPFAGGKTLPPEAPARDILNPADHRQRIGTVVDASTAQVQATVARAARAQPGWDRRPVTERAAVLEKLSDLLERHRAELTALLVREAGKTISDALAEVREAVDFCRYYAAQARAVFEPSRLPGPTGERNLLTLHGRGVFLCVSPWNFPLAIFLGQVAAALVAGNAVVAKPAPQTPLIACRVAKLALESGVPPDVLAILPGGAAVGEALLLQPGLAGVAFTGSVATAKRIARALADRPGPILPLIAETGGQNAMIVDASALPEQVVDDVVTSSFRSAGQRCSALRVLFLPRSTAARIEPLLAGARRYGSAIPGG